MTTPAAVTFVETDLDALAKQEGVLACFVPAEGTLSPEARRLNRLTKGAIKRAVESAAFDKLGNGKVLDIAFPAGLSATTVAITKLPRRPDAAKARAAGAELAKLRGSRALTILGGAHR
ncbi:MAG: leucyl aminopeptidase, partial [Pseudomonadota bacterium]